METKKYRKIWEEANGPIPVDSEGRTFEIHHINGDHNDNRLENLACLSIMDHFQTHYEQGDWEACILILQRMDLSLDVIKERQSEIGKKVRDEKKGIHTDDIELRREWASYAGKQSAKVNKAFINQQGSFEDKEFAKIAGSKSGKKPVTNGIITKKLKTEEEVERFLGENTEWRRGHHWTKNSGKKNKSA